MLTILYVILGVLLGIIVIAAVAVLGVQLRFQQLKDSRYTDQQRFEFVSWVVSWAAPLLTGIKVEVEGLEKLDQVEYGVIYANHQSNIDIVTLLKAIKRPHGYVAKKELDNIFLLSDGMRLIRCEFMDRNDVRQSVKVISSAGKTVKEGHLMVIFPEGTRMVKADVGSFKAGSFKLAQKAKADIIPVTIFNSYEMAKRWPRRTVVKMRVHDPIKYADYEATPTNDLCEQVEMIIKKPL